ncbi:MAG: hydrogenase iron-sulfur subunit [Methanomassiliicoccales archaeon]|nr:hydrogenase iron-sulfur subunit [Methanomassiliicoccales archaeon]MDD1755308.1 hydrogenase iron-sulfur subunit [Methanomassiliicoccales archaeon]
MSDFEPKVIVFLCNWCSYAGADLAGVSRYQYPTNIRTVRVMCSTRVSPHIVLELLKDGADGVIVTGCHPGDCHYINGNYYTEKRMDLAQRLLKMTGMEPERLKLDWVSASEGEKFSHLIQEFVTKLKEIGPNPVSKDKKLVTRLEAAVDASKYFRLKVLTGKDINLTSKGNVYGETLKLESLDEIMAKATEDEYRNSLILQLTNHKAYSVKELATEIGEPTDKTLEHVVSLRAKNMLALDHIEGTTPKYKAITIGGA